MSDQKTVTDAEENLADANEALAAAVEALARRASGKVYLYARNLLNGAEVNRNGDVVQQCASEAKVFVLLAFAAKVAAGEIDPKERVRLAKSAYVPGSGLLRFAQAGLRPSPLFLAYLMMTVSDNTATNILLEMVGGPRSLERQLAGWRVPNTMVEGKLWQGNWIQSSARGLARAVEIIADPETFGYPQAAAELCREVMARHLDDNGLARHMAWSPFAHDVVRLEQFAHAAPALAGMEIYAKSGWVPGYRGDVALCVTGHGRYVVGLKITNVADMRLNAAGEGSTLSAEVGRLLFKYWG